jgi:DNA-binding transcriptional ArsR family regulator
MRGEPDIASVAALIGVPARAMILAALADGRALPAGELAAASGLSLSGASAHLALLQRGRLLTVEREGRHRYYRLAGPQVAAALEALAPLATMTSAERYLSPAVRALRQGRTCYDHLAGEIGVVLAEALERHDFIAPGHGKCLEVTARGADFFAHVFGIQTSSLRPGRHGVARRCLDWTERRHHIAGPLGAALLRRCRELGFVKPGGANPRAVTLSVAGADFMRRQLGVTPSTSC